MEGRPTLRLYHRDYLRLPTLPVGSWPAPGPALRLHSLCASVSRRAEARCASPWRLRGRARGPYRRRPRSQRCGGSEHGAWRWLATVLVGAAEETEAVEVDEPGYPSDQLELISEVHLRRGTRPPRRRPDHRLASRTLMAAIGACGSVDLMEHVLLNPTARKQTPRTLRGSLVPRCPRCVPLPVQSAGRPCRGAASVDVRRPRLGPRSTASRITLDTYSSQAQPSEWPEPSRTSPNRRTVWRTINGE
jgi:hypothetical protein